MQKRVLGLTGPTGAGTVSYTHLDVYKRQVLGYLDDLILLPALVAITIRMLPPKVLSRCREEAALLWQEDKAKRWYFAVPFVLLWILILFLILKAIF